MSRTEGSERQQFRPTDGSIQRPSGRRVLLAAGPRDPELALQRAGMLAELLGAELHVLRVLPPPPAVRAFLPHLREKDATRTLDQTIACFRSTRALCREVLGSLLPETRLDVSTGAFVETVARHATSLNALLVIIPAHDKDLGMRVTTLASAIGKPVMVARAAGSEETVIAATDLQDERYPVLREASELAHQLSLRMVAVHNLAPLLALGIHAEWPVAILLDRSAADTRKQRLDRATARLDASSQAVMVEEPSAVDAILAQARSRGADLVIVGTRPRSWLDAVFRGSVPAKVVERARRSVLVIPIVEQS